MLLFSFLFYKESMCALLYCKGLKLTFGIKVVIGFMGMPLFIRVNLSWVYDKPNFSGISTMVIIMVEENGKQF
jgi:hypothetical protein